MIYFAEAAIGSDGELACARCAPSATPQMRALEEVLAELSAIADGWPGGPGPNVRLIGAEPFTHPGLPQVIEAAVRTGFERIALRSDAGALTHARNATGVMGAGVRHLELILLGGSHEAHDRLSGRPGLFAAAAEGVAAFAEAGRTAGAETFIAARSTVCRHNVADLPAIAAAAAGFGAAALTLDVTGLPDRREHRAFVDAALDTATVNRVAACVVGWECVAAPSSVVPVSSTSGASR